MLKPWLVLMKSIDMTRNSIKTSLQPNRGKRSKSKLVRLDSLEPDATSGILSFCNDIGYQSLTVFRLTAASVEWTILLKEVQYNSLRGNATKSPRSLLIRLVGQGLTTARRCMVWSIDITLPLWCINLLQHVYVPCWHISFYICSLQYNAPRPSLVFDSTALARQKL